MVEVALWSPDPWRQALETLWIDFVDKFHVPFWQILQEYE